jgi:Activator of Hsp90 ATPase homolog 1-like protein
MWTSRIGTWWPADHTVTGDRDVAIVLESGVGGRIYERTADGAEYDWGVVTVWDPPKRLAYVPVAPRQDRSEATDVDIRFVARGPDDTRLEIEHRGWERLGATADAWRDRNRIGWETLLPRLAAAITRGDR